MNSSCLGRYNLPERLSRIHRVTDVVSINGDRSFSAFWNLHYFSLVIKSSSDRVHTSMSKPYSVKASVPFWLNPPVRNGPYRIEAAPIPGIRILVVEARKSSVMNCHDFRTFVESFMWAFTPCAVMLALPTRSGTILDNELPLISKPADTKSMLPSMEHSMQVTSIGAPDGKGKSLLVIVVARSNRVEVGAAESTGVGTAWVMLGSVRLLLLTTCRRNFRWSRTRWADVVYPRSMLMELNEDCHWAGTTLNVAISSDNSAISFTLVHVRSR